MNFSKSKVLLKKINAIHDSADAFDGQLSALEKDLMLQYLRDLYECVIGDNAPAVAKKVEKLTPPEPAKVTVAPAPPVVPAPKVEAPAPVVEHQVVSQPVVTSTPTPQPVRIDPVDMPMPAGASRKNVQIDPEMEALFEVDKGSDLSTRFANAPVKDINRAIGINEKILTINELFAGDQQAFNKTVEALNGLSSFEEAKQYLIGSVATDNNWSDAKKKKKAEVFIKLISRRYQ